MADKQRKGNLMKRTIIAAIMLGAVLALAFTVNTILHQANAQSVAPNTGRVNTAERLRSPCSFKSVLPSALSLKLECDSCCDSGHGAYEYCRNFTNKSTCECIQAGYEACMDGGCGPCQCCEDWLTRGRWHGCINDEAEWKKKRTAVSVGLKR